MFLKPSKSQIKFWSKLRLAKYRRQEGAFTAEGMKIVQELFRSPWEAAAIMVMEGREDRWATVAASLPRRIDTYLLTRGDWKGISQDKEPEGIMAQVVMPDHLKTGRLPIDIQGHVLLGHRISNPNNLGSLLRTAHWFGIQTVILSKDSVDVTHPKVVRSAMGSLFHLYILEEMDLAPLISDLKNSHIVVGTDAALGVPPHAAVQRTALIVGNETHGLPANLQSFVDECWRIPGAGGAESLSLPQAAAVMMYELTSRENRR
jgi:TrmH family RNA methyltransferase